MYSNNILYFPKVACMFLEQPYLFKLCTPLHTDHFII